MKRQIISIQMLIVVCVFCITTTIGITKYVVSSLYDIEIKRLTSELAPVTTGETRSGMTVANTNEKNAFHCGYYFSMIDVLNRAIVFTKEILLLAGVDAELPELQKEFKVFEAFEPELSIMTQSLGIDIHIPVKFFEDWHVMDKTSVKKCAQELYTKLSREIRIRHGKRVYKSFELGRELGRAMALMILMESMIIFKQGDVKLMFTEEVKNGIQAAVKVCEELDLNKKLFEDLRNYSRKGESVKDLEKAVKPIQDYYE